MLCVLPHVLLRLSLIAAVVLVLHLGISRALALVVSDAGDLSTWGSGLLGLLLVAYALLLAVPFVPGVEIGVSLLMLRGSEIAPLVYLSTTLGLTGAYLAGRYMPETWIVSLFQALHLERAARLVEQVAPLSRDRRLALLRSGLPGRLGAWAVRWRYLALALLVNLPGSGLLGGGGGLCLLAGLSGIYAPRATALTLALAVLPVPLLVWLLGPAAVGL